MRSALGLVLVALVLLAACGSDDDENDGAAPVTAGTDAAADTEMADDESADMAMNMGDPDARPAEDVDGAELVNGDFALLDTRPEGYDDVTGTAAMARHDDGTTVTIRLEGLRPEVEFIAHVHDGPCTENGGDHYKFDPEGSDVPPNEIHLAFTSDDDGFGFMTAENAMVAGPEAQSVVVHPIDLLDNKIACVQF